MNSCFLHIAHTTQEYLRVKQNQCISNVQSLLLPVLFTYSDRHRLYPTNFITNITKAIRLRCYWYIAINDISNVVYHCFGRSFLQSVTQKLLKSGENKYELVPLHSRSVVNVAIGTCRIQLSYTMWLLNGLIVLNWLRKKIGKQIKYLR